jgi:hypothetical protein
MALHEPIGDSEVHFPVESEALPDVSARIGTIQTAAERPGLDPLKAPFKPDSVG